MGEHPEAKQPNGSSGILHIPCSPNSSTSSLTATTQEEPSRIPIIPRNFVWRLQGGRRASTSTNSTEPDQEDAMAAVDVVAMDGPINGVLRDSFDPWNRHNHRRQKGGGKWSATGQDADDDEVCKGCIKISRARASTALRDRKRAGSHGELVLFTYIYLLSMLTGIPHEIFTAPIIPSLTYLQIYKPRSKQSPPEPPRPTDEALYMLPFPSTSQTC